MNTLNQSTHQKARTEYFIRRAPHPDNTGGFDYAILESEGRIIAEVFEHVGYATEAHGLDKRDAEKTAMLFAAAPELLEACERLVETFRAAWDKKGISCYDIALAERAIAKAKGEGK